MIAYVKLFQIYVLKLDATLVVRILFLDFVNSIFMQKYNSVKIPQKKICLIPLKIIGAPHSFNNGPAWPNFILIGILFSHHFMHYYCNTPPCLGCVKNK